MKKIIIALWAVPRSVSTAFERIFIERGDAKVMHEPWSEFFYHSDERGHKRYSDSKPRHECGFDETLSEVLRPHDKSFLFFKNMAYNLRDKMNPELLSLFTNTFIIRNPQDALTSHYRVLPDFDIVEAGYTDQKRLFDIVVEECRQEPIVVDADDFRNNPSRIMKRYCEMVGIKYIPEAMLWEQRDIAIWGLKDIWQQDAIRTTRINPPSEKREKITLPERIIEMVNICNEHYQAMYRYRIQT